jgi:hypothetical protein
VAFNRALTTELGSRIFTSRQARLALLRAAWPTAVGPLLARRTEVLAIEGVSLRIRVADTRWRKVLYRMRHRILDRLREVAGTPAPERLGFTEGPITTAPEEERQPKEPAPKPSVSPQLAEQAAAIADDELRRLFLETAARYLERVRAGSGPADEEL